MGLGVAWSVRACMRCPCRPDKKELIVKLPEEKCASWSWLEKALSIIAEILPGRGHRDSTWTSTGLKVTVAGCWLLLLLGPWAEGVAGLGLLGSSSRLALIFLLYIFSKIRTTVKMMMTTTTMAATMAPELLYRKSSSLVVTFNEKKVVPPKGVAVVISIQ